MSNIVSYKFHDYSIRTLLKPDQSVWFCRKDVLSALDLSYNTKLLQSLKTDGIANSEVIDKLGRRQQLIFVNEPNLYRMIFKSTKQAAKEFQDWVFDEVLPAIRKYGAYLARNEKLISDIDPQEVRWYKPSRKTYFSKAVQDFLKARPLTPKEFELFMDALRTAMDEGQENVLMANQDNRMILDDATTNKLLTYLKWLNSNENKFKSLASRMRHLAVELSDAASDLNLYSEGFGITRGILTGRIEDTVKRLKRNN